MEKQIPFGNDKTRKEIAGAMVLAPAIISSASEL
jgi:hypothetical protein